jgi:hypothetical protein
VTTGRPRTSRLSRRRSRSSSAPRCSATTHAIQRGRASTSAPRSGCTSAATITSAAARRIRRAGRLGLRRRGPDAAHQASEGAAADPTKPIMKPTTSELRCSNEQPVTYGLLVSSLEVQSRAAHLEVERIVLAADAMLDVEVVPGGVLAAFHRHAGLQPDAEFQLQRVVRHRHRGVRAGRPKPAQAMRASIWFSCMGGELLLAAPVPAAWVVMPDGRRHDEERVKIPWARA